TPPRATANAALVRLWPGWYLVHWTDYVSLLTPTRGAPAMSRPRRDWQQPGEPYASLYTHEWRNGTFLIGAMPEPEQGYYRAFFAHLDAGWRIVQPLQLAAESLLNGHSPLDDVANWVD